LKFACDIHNYVLQLYIIDTLYIQDTNDTVVFILPLNIIYGRSAKKSYFLHFGHIDWYISHGTRTFRPLPGRINLLRDLLIATLKVSNVYNIFLPLRPLEH